MRKIQEEISGRKPNTFPFSFLRRLFESETRLLTDPSKRIKIRGGKRFSADSVLRMFHSANRFDLFFSSDTSDLTVIRHKLQAGSYRNLGLISRPSRSLHEFPGHSGEKVFVLFRGKADQFRWKRKCSVLP